MVDLSKIKPGDEVTVRAKVAAIHSAFLTLQTDDGSPEEFQSYASGIVSHTPKALAVGDRVKVPGGSGYKYRVLCIDGDAAWCRLEATEERVTLGLAGLERADD